MPRVHFPNSAMEGFMDGDSSPRQDIFTADAPLPPAAAVNGYLMFQHAGKAIPNQHFAIDTADHELNAPPPLTLALQHAQETTAGVIVPTTAKLLDSTGMVDYAVLNASPANKVMLGMTDGTKVIELTLNPATGQWMNDATHLVEFTAQHHAGNVIEGEIPLHQEFSAAALAHGIQIGFVGLSGYLSNGIHDVVTIHS